MSQGHDFGVSFVEADSSKSLLRLAVSGPSKFGKTFTSLCIATEMVRLLRDRAELDGSGEIGVIDTEHGTAKKHAGRRISGRVLKFITPERPLTNFHPDNYIKLIRAFEARGVSFLVIDSLSHEWFGKGGILELHADKSKQRKDSFAAWQDVNPLHNALVEAILASPLHIISTLRSKMKHVRRGSDIAKVGLKLIQREGLDFEYDALGEMSQDHCIRFDGARYPEIDRKTFKPIKEGLPAEDDTFALAALLVECVTRGSNPIPSAPQNIPDETVRLLLELRAELELPDDRWQSAIHKRGVSRVEDIDPIQAEEMIRNMRNALTQVRMKRERQMSLASVPVETQPVQPETPTDPSPAQVIGEQLVDHLVSQSPGGSNASDGAGTANGQTSEPMEKSESNNADSSGQATADSSLLGDSAASGDRESSGDVTVVVDSEVSGSPAADDSSSESGVAESSSPKRQRKAAKAGK